MNTAEWILVAFLSLALLTFLILGIILLIKLIGITKEAQKIVLTGQNIATKTEDVVENVKDLTSIGSIVKTFTHKYYNEKSKKPNKKG